ncbi:helix-turn-helix domain-containing protein [Shewanella surugensis]|uniref:Helix-turn-helix domain-containing protein n=1 Tax=Shewanella surugensis TaxID=212020 RepID=A0ABT0LIA9_9GAMM|nr:helix-turn-helix domain-containing protein [Shewanella surugensis]MCL1127421.1 hypothetical protein [Shewanella surugensis]
MRVTSAELGVYRLLIRVLSEHELITLEEAFKNHPKHRCRIRAHAIINSYHGFSIKQIAQILLVKGETVSSWLDQWFEHVLFFFMTVNELDGQQSITQLKIND